MTVRSSRFTIKFTSCRSESTCRFRPALERLGVTQLTRVRGGFISGDRRRNLRVPGAPDFCRWCATRSYSPAMRCRTAIVLAGSMITSGDIWGGRLSREAVERPGWILNVTNDGWFGLSAGPYQHFQQARVRAIEEGLPIVRAANTGISAVVDPLAASLSHSRSGTAGVLDTALPQPIDPHCMRGWGTAQWRNARRGIGARTARARRPLSEDPSGTRSAVRARHNRSASTVAIK